MALYVPAGRRRRNVILGLVGAVVVGLLIGAVLGRVTAPTVSDKVSSVQDSARAVTARLRATPIEYQKQLSGSSEFQSGGTALQALNDAHDTLSSAMDDAVWMGAAQRKELDDSLTALVQAARDKVTADRYETLVDEAATRIDTAFGIQT